MLRRGEPHLGYPFPALFCRNRAPVELYAGGRIAAPDPVDHQQDGAPAGRGSGRPAAGARRAQADAHRHGPHRLPARPGNAGEHAPADAGSARHPGLAARQPDGRHPAHDQCAVHARLEGLPRAPPEHQPDPAGRHGPANRAQGGGRRAGNRHDGAAGGPGTGPRGRGSGQLPDLGPGRTGHVPEKPHDLALQGAGRAAAGVVKG